MTEIADSLTWLKGRHTVKMGLDWRWERLNVVQPPWPTGTFIVQHRGQRFARRHGTGNPFASFLLGQVQTFAIDFQQSEIQERAHFQEYFIQDDWKVSDRLTINPGLRYTLNFPSTEINGQTAVFNLETRQLDYPGDRACPAAQEEQLRASHWRRLPSDRQDHRQLGIRARLDRNGGITTPFTTPTFPFLQEVTQRTLDNISPAFRPVKRTTVTPLTRRPTAGLGQGVFAVNGGLGSGYAQQWNASVQRELTTNTVVEVSYLGSKITRVGIPDSNSNQLTEEQLRLGPALITPRVSNPYLRHHSAIVLDWRPDGDPRAAHEAVSGIHGRQPLPEQRRRHQIPGPGIQHSSTLVARTDVLGCLHAFDAEGHRLVGVRRVDPHRAADQCGRGRQLQSGS